MRDAVRKPWETAVPVGHANRRRASENLDDALASPACAKPMLRFGEGRPAASLLPGGSPARSLGVIIKDLWYHNILWWAMIVAGFAAALIHWPIDDRPVARLAARRA